MTLLSWCPLEAPYVCTRSAAWASITTSRVERLLEGGARRESLVVIAHIGEPRLVVQLQQAQGTMLMEQTLYGV